MKRSILVTVVLVALLAGASAQTLQPYAGMHTRQIKALSEQQIADLRAGRGMAMALPAELNRYPGPLHVLEHAAALDLTPEQKEQLTRQVEAMQTAAIALGEHIIARESELDAHFRSGAADAGTIDRITSEIAALYGQLRAVHLRTHLATRASLTEIQLAKYQTLRGYDAGGTDPVHKH
jgi:hypothetical protein